VKKTATRIPSGMTVYMLVCDKSPRMRLVTSAIADVRGRSTKSSKKSLALEGNEIPSNCQRRWMGVAEGFLEH
jgi:hypothetical protein